MKNENSENLPIEPTEGMGCTISYGSDRYPFTCVSVQGDTVLVTPDRSKRVDKNGQSESQEYTFEPQTHLTPQIFTRRKNGSWVKKGESLKNGTRLHIGTRQRYEDPSY